MHRKDASQNTLPDFFFRFIAAVTFVLPLSACATLYGAATEGQVLEEGTNKPIPEAIVIVRWGGVIPTIGHASSVCVHVENATTNKDGHYRTKAWTAPSTVGPAPLIQMNIGPGAYACKPGYEYIDTQGQTVYLKPFTGSRGERLEYLSRAAVSCSHIKEIEIKLLPLYKALYEEASSIAVTKEEKLKALHHLKDIEKLEIGSTQAWENFHRREKELK
ncbi:MAG: hypothetical protein WD823_08790 [Sulfuricaulis sp.]|uniref:hypothetical protein n=1 Tax=Sulfuricaulis sp. TaxID=2003553 RepID=UPI0034A0D764